VPTYDYVCTACGYEVEVVHSVHGHGPSACTKCGGAMKRSFTPPAVHYKGSGWARKEKGSGRPSAGKAKSSAGSGEAGSGRVGSSETETGTSGASESSPSSPAESKPSGDGR
jgi:putative FmdB family regulatory protein